MLPKLSDSKVKLVSTEKSLFCCTNDVKMPFISSSDENGVIVGYSRLNSLAAACRCEILGIEV